MKLDRTVLALLVSLAGAAALCAQQPAPPPPAAQKMEMSEKPGMMDESMMAHHKEMMAKMESMEARLDALVKKMNAASGSRKAAAVAAVVNELVAQHKEMRGQMMAMHPETTDHMTGHMGMMKGMDDSMAECPMMKNKTPATDPHSEHQHN